MLCVQPLDHVTRSSVRVPGAGVWPGVPTCGCYERPGFTLQVVNRTCGRARLHTNHVRVGWRCPSERYAARALPGLWYGVQEEGRGVATPRPDCLRVNQLMSMGGRDTHISERNDHTRSSRRRTRLLVTHRYLTLARRRPLLWVKGAEHVGWPSLSAAVAYKRCRSWILQRHLCQTGYLHEDALRWWRQIPHFRHQQVTSAAAGF